MKYFRMSVVILLGCFAFAGQPTPASSAYVVGIRLKGPNWTPNLDTDAGRRMMEGHIAVIEKMFTSGKLLAAGPFTDPTELRGLLLFQECTVEQARAMAEEDPVVKGGQIRIEYHTWSAPQKLRSAP